MQCLKFTYCLNKGVLLGFMGGGVCVVGFLVFVGGGLVWFLTASQNVSDKPYKMYAQT